MKKYTLVICLFFAAIFAKAQSGLEGIIVEKYYVSDANDTMANMDGGVLPIGSVTYRIFVDMLPGYTFQACYGVPGVAGQCPAHELKIETSTLFFNNEDRGAVHPTIPFSSTDNNTVMLDSWLSVGAACNGWFGIPKVEDNGVGTVVNSYSPQVLQNNNAAAGIPLTQQDGLIQVLNRTPLSVTEVGLTSPVNILEMFNNQNDGTNGPSFITSNGAWSALGGTMGPDSITNKVLIAQITTDGVLTFELNVQLGTPIPGLSESYVARNAACGEFLDSTLIYNSSLTSGTWQVATEGPAFSLYRNPTSDYFNMMIFASRKAGNYSYAIYTLDGKKVSGHALGMLQGDSMHPVDLSALSSGTYIVELNADGLSTARRVVKF
ncbi:MAG: T9SS type A sorting domain-containing protein [Bacteroidia bacterium]|nr:T9SS type A sorting domain-containing protein [Bacteroidia bacterium]